MTRFLLCLAALAVGTFGSARAQVTDPCFRMDSTAWNPGPAWETVGDCATTRYERLFFDPEGTLYAVRRNVDTLDVSGGAPGVWRRIVMNPVFLSFIDMLPLTTADSLVGQESGSGQGAARTVDRHQTWTVTDEVGQAVNLYATPPGAAHAGRIFGSEINGSLQISDDRGGSWRPAAAYPEGYELEATNPAAFPAGPGPWGAGYGGRMITAGFDYGVSLSDDGGDTWRRSSLWPGGRYFEAAVLARPASEGGGLRAVVIGVGPTAPNGCAAVWTSDDGGDSWTARAPICEPCSVGQVCARPVALLPLAQRQAGGAPVSGPAADWPETEWETTEAVALMTLGGLFRTRDGGATWTREQIPLRRPNVDSIKSGTLSPDGRLYVGVGRLAPGGAWMLRSAEGFVVARDEAPPAPPASSLAVSVRPNPSGGGPVVVTVASDRPSASVRVVVVDARGRVVARLHDGPAGGALTLSLDGSRLAPGVYTVRAESAADVVTARLTITR